MTGQEPQATQRYSVPYKGEERAARKAPSRGHVGSALGGDQVSRQRSGNRNGSEARWEHGVQQGITPGRLQPHPKLPVAGPGVLENR